MLGDIARAQASDTLDVVVWKSGTSFYAGVARHGFLAMRDTVSMPYPTEADARAEANRYYAQIRQGKAFSRTVSLYRHDALSTMHARQAEVLRDIPRKYRNVVVSRAHLLQNLTGGILSGNLWTAASEFRAIGAHALEARSKADNHAAMKACARQGCEGCARSTK